MRETGKILIIAAVVAFSSSTALLTENCFASELAKELFHFETGQALDPLDENFNSIDPEQIRSLISPVRSLCSDDATQTCIAFQLQLPESISEDLVLASVLSAINVWGSTPLLSLRLTYEGVALDQDGENFQGYPFEMELNSDGQSVQVLDGFNQPVLGGPFFISFAPPADLEFRESEMTKLVRYRVPNFEMEEAPVSWAGIYINPAFNPLLECDSQTGICLELDGVREFSLHAVLVHEIGRVLGLAPSLLPTSLLFPVQRPNQTKSFGSLKPEDLRRASKLYGRQTFAGGDLKGQIKDGTDGTGWYGAHVFLVKAENMENFMSSGSLSYVNASAWSREEGSFEFSSLSPGEYFLFAESSFDLNLNPSLFDSEYQWKHRASSFPPELYDGAHRESNYEPIYSISYQSQFYAAKLIVEENVINHGLELITNQVEMDFEVLWAAGSSNEILSEFTAIRNQEGIDQEAARDQDSLRQAMRSGGSCQIAAHSSLGFSWIGILLLIWSWSLMQSRQLQKREKDQKSSRQTSRS